MLVYTIATRWACGVFTALLQVSCFILPRAGRFEWFSSVVQSNFNQFKLARLIRSRTSELGDAFQREWKHSLLHRVCARAFASCYRIGHCLSTSVYICRSRPLSFRYLEQPPRGQLTGSSDSRGWISCLQTSSSSIIIMVCFVTSSWLCLRKLVNWFNQARTVFMLRNGLYKLNH